MPTFGEILSAPTLFASRNVLSPHYLPELLPFREKEIEKLMLAVAPALTDQRPRNLFIYGKTGTGKTCTVRNVMGKFEAHAAKDAEGAKSKNAKWTYINCRMYNSRYRTIQKIAKEFIPELDKSGFGVATLYEKFAEYVQGGKLRLILVLDEVDMVRDLDELIYTLTRMNDELSSGSVSIIGITNKLSFKDTLDPRSKSSLCETEMVFASYTQPQLAAILEQRCKEGFKEGAVDESAVNLAAAIAASETGDARYALTLLLKAGEFADERKMQKITDKEVEMTRRNVDTDLATQVIVSLPAHPQLVLLGVCNLTLEGRKYAKLSSRQSSLTGGAADGRNGGTGASITRAQESVQAANDENEPYLLSGEVYEEYVRLCRQHHKPKRSARWYREYLNDLEMLGLIVTIESGKGMRGHTRLIKVGYSADQMRVAIEKAMTIIESKDDDEDLKRVEKLLPNKPDEGKAQLRHTTEKAQREGAHHPPKTGDPLGLDEN